MRRQLNKVFAQNIALANNAHARRDEGKGNMKDDQQRDSQGIDVMPINLAAVQAAAESLARRAQEMGVVLTIEQQPLQPLRMGHYRTVVSVRRARGK